MSFLVLTQERLVYRLKLSLRYPWLVMLKAETVWG